MACSVAKEEVFSPTKSRIQVYVNESRCFGVPNICEHCTDPPCLPVCPVKCIAKDPDSGIVRIDVKTCIGCGRCKEACPFDSIRIRDKKAYKCDLCDGDPACTKVCYPYALQYVERQPATIRDKIRLAEERLRALASLDIVKGIVSEV